MIKKKLGMLMLVPVAGISIFACATASEKAISSEELSYRNVPLTVNTAPPPVEFPKEPPGEAKRFTRAYENAPPMIPHSVEGLLPITKDNNACLGCHMPDVAKDTGATPISPTHFIDFFRLPEGKIVKLQDLDPARFNCSQCHAPQAKTKPLVKNIFKPDYRDPSTKEKTKLYKNLLEGVK